MYVSDIEHAEWLWKPTQSYLGDFHIKEEGGFLSEMWFYTARGVDLRPSHTSSYATSS